MPSLSTQPTRLAVPSHAAAPFVSPKVKDTAFAFVAATVFRFYRFLTHSHDKAAMGKLGDKVKLLFEDAPVLQDRINPNAPIESTDLAQAYCGRVKGNAIALIPLSSCGKNLFRTAVVELAFGPGKGKSDSLSSADRRPVGSRP